jgi:hypothetical protein
MGTEDQTVPLSHEPAKALVTYRSGDGVCG